MDEPKVNVVVEEYQPMTVVEDTRVTLPRLYTGGMAVRLLNMMDISAASTWRVQTHLRRIQRLDVATRGAFYSANVESYGRRVVHKSGEAKSVGKVSIGTPAP